MAGSDSESDSDCFESAEESLDEEEKKKEIKTRSKKKSKESESEVTEPVVSQNDRVNETLTAEDVSNNSLTYRKRPERVKRTPSIPSSKATPTRKKSSETVFGTDVADVFFQDITINLSKNINKSLHTLHQTSSSVKGLILGSLPVVSTCEEGGFLYDDNLNTSLAPDDNDESNKSSDDEIIETKEYLTELPESAQADHHKIKENLNVQDRDSETFIHKNESLIESAQISGEKESQLNLNPEDNETILDSSKLISEEIQVILKVTSAPSEEVNILTDDICDDYLETIVNEEKENIKKDCSVNQNLSASKLNDSKSANTDENKISSCQSLEDISSKNNLKIDEPLPEELSSYDGAEIKNHCTTKILTNVLPNLQIQNVDNSLAESKSFSVLSDNTEEKNKKEVEDAEPDSKKEEEIVETNNKSYTIAEDFNKIEEHKELDLKTSAAQMKVDKDVILKDKTESLEYKTFQTDIDVKETAEKNNEDNDGWDDFDFSDNELEDDKSSNSGKAKNAEDNRAEQETSTHISDSFKTKTDLKTKDVKQAEVDANKKEQTKVTEGLRNAHQKKEPFKVQETNEVYEGWDWDTWDDDTDYMEEKNGKSLQSIIKAPVNNEKPQNKIDDRIAWSGLDTLSQKIEQKQGNWNIGSWGVNMLLNKATAVTQGISNVLEAGLGVPDPETFARMQKEEERQFNQEVVKTESGDQQQEEIAKKNSLTGVNLFPVSGITNLVAGVTSKIVEHTKIQEIGSKVITGGLDTLETFGKKTMEVLQDGDPGLRNKRSLLMGDNKPVLSQILREAREKADKEIKEAEEKASAKKCHFETSFDDFQGMVHLEALEMLSRQYELKLEQIKSGMNSEELEDLEGVLEEVEQLCALDDLDLNSSVLDFKTSLQMAVEPLKNEISVGQIIQIHDNVHKWFQTSKLDLSLTTLHQNAVSTVAELTAATVHQFHKAGELLSIKECRKTVDEVDALSKLTNILCLEINKICDKFVSMLSDKSNKESDSANTITEKVIVMRNNATSYIKQAFNLLIPVLQAGAAL